MSIFKEDMTGLTKTAIIARKIIRLGIFGILAIIIARALILTSIKIYRKINPPPPPPPTVTFGRLPSLPFPQKEFPQGISFVLETPEGELPKFPEQVKVYFMPKLSSNLLSFDIAKQKSSKLGFSTTAIKSSETIYSFSHPKVPSTLTLNTVTGSFSISYNLATDSSPIEKQPQAPEVAAAIVRSYLSSADVFPDDLTGPTVPEFVKFENGQITGALSLSDADLVKMNFYRKSYDNYPSVTPNTSESNVWFMVSGSREREKQIVAAEFHYFPVDETSSATYPIKTSQMVWDQLLRGEAYIANFGTNEKNIVIRRIYIAYYDPDTMIEFFQPIAVFEGDNSFVAYTPLVTPDYYGE